jgi:TRAP-type C4-dicarboxylate transport system permease small subunit
LGAREGRHITIDVVTRRVPAAVRRVLTAASQAASAGVCAWLAVAGARFLQDEAELGDRTFLELPVWIPEAVIPAAFALMAARFVLGSIGCWRGPARLDAPHSPP